MTVEPAKKTALPEVPFARAIDSADGVAVPELATVAVEDEERVVDPDREAEHHAEDRGDGDHLHHARERQGAERADPDAEQRGDDRQRGSDHGPHDQQQDDRCDHEAGHLAERRRGSGSPARSLTRS